MTKLRTTVGLILVATLGARAEAGRLDQPSVGNGGAAIVVSNNTNQTLHFDLAFPGETSTSQATLGPGASQEYPCPTSTGCEVVIGTDNGQVSRASARAGDRVALRWNGTSFQAVKQ